MATITTERASPRDPRSFSMNSRTSRPRSPTRAITATSASVPRAIIDSRVDFPTPDPAKTPIRCPRPTGTKASIARTPTPSWRSTLDLESAIGAAFSTETIVVPVSGPRLSIGLPRPSRTRPRRARPTCIWRGPPVAATSTPGPMPKIGPSGMQVNRPPLAETTSAGRSPPGNFNMTRSPTADEIPSTATVSPMTDVTEPVILGRAAAIARRVSISRLMLRASP
ncbi:hypothetical protein GALL_493780 [mine drainage metagenome]|uniref:Uncharacterized protein n=1 Tax=mine drainage metagenome TaxID=410659 RepID=A0A1J5PCG8_9ZZZZ